MIYTFCSNLLDNHTLLFQYIYSCFIYFFSNPNFFLKIIDTPNRALNYFAGAPNFFFFFFPFLILSLFLPIW